MALIVVIVETDFFFRKFGVTLERSTPGNVDKNDPQLHMIAYLQVAIISQALIFVTRAHSFFFMERPSFALMGAFCIAQLISSIIAAYGDWGFTNIAAISGGWIGIIWVWVDILHWVTQAFTEVLLSQNIVWFIPLDWVKFAMDATVIKHLRERRLGKQREDVASGAPLERTPSRVASIHESLYSNRTSFLQRATRKMRIKKNVRVPPTELSRVSSIQTQRAGRVLARHPSPQAVPGVPTTFSGPASTAA